MPRPLLCTNGKEAVTLLRGLVKKRDAGRFKDTVQAVSRGIAVRSINSQDAASMLRLLAGARKWAGVVEGPEHTKFLEVMYRVLARDIEVMPTLDLHSVLGTVFSFAHRPPTASFVTATCISRLSRARLPLRQASSFALLATTRELLPRTAILRHITHASHAKFLSPQTVTPLIKCIATLRYTTRWYQTLHSRLLTACIRKNFTRSITSILAAVLLRYIPSLQTCHRLQQRVYLALAPTAVRWFEHSSTPTGHIISILRGYHEHKKEDSERYMTSMRSVVVAGFNALYTREVPPAQSVKLFRYLAATGVPVSALDEEVWALTLARCGAHIATLSVRDLCRLYGALARLRVHETNKATWNKLKAQLAMRKDEISLGDLALLGSEVEGVAYGTVVRCLRDSTEWTAVHTHVLKVYAARSSAGAGEVCEALVEHLRKLPRKVYTSMTWHDRCTVASSVSKGRKTATAQIVVKRLCNRKRSWQPASIEAAILFYSAAACRVTSDAIVGMSALIQPRFLDTKMMIKIANAHVKMLVMNSRLRDECAKRLTSLQVRYPMNVEEYSVALNALVKLDGKAESVDTTKLIERLRKYNDDVTGEVYAHCVYCIKLLGGSTAGLLARYNTRCEGPSHRAVYKLLLSAEHGKACDYLDTLFIKAHSYMDKYTRPEIFKLITIRCASDITQRSAAALVNMCSAIYMRLPPAQTATLWRILQRNSRWVARYPFFEKFKQHIERPQRPAKQPKLPPPAKPSKHAALPVIKPAKLEVSRATPYVSQPQGKERTKGFTYAPLKQW